jgi:hypothetical protein
MKMLSNVQLVLLNLLSLNEGTIADCAVWFSAQAAHKSTLHSPTHDYARLVLTVLGLSFKTGTSQTM